MKNRIYIADHTTWCGTDMVAGVKLAEILNKEYPAHIHEVNTIFCKYDQKLNALKLMKSSVHLKYFGNLFITESKKLVKNKKFPLGVETHLLNVMTAKYRKIIES